MLALFFELFACPDKVDVQPSPAVPLLSSPNPACSAKDRRHTCGPPGLALELPTRLPARGLPGAAEDAVHAHRTGRQAHQPGELPFVDRVAAAPSNSHDIDMSG
jgi:hypothetical protein